MHLNRSAGYAVQPIPFLWFGAGGSGSLLYEIYLTFHDEIVLHLLFPVAEVRPVELPKAHFG